MYLTIVLSSQDRKFSMGEVLRTSLGTKPNHGTLSAVMSYPISNEVNGLALWYAERRRIDVKCDWRS